MSRSAADIAREFLSVVWDGATPNMDTVSRALDRLLAQSHDVPFIDSDVDDRDPPTVDVSVRFREVSERFSDYRAGHEATYGNPVDDLADLTQELREVVWRDENLGTNDATWFFRLMYSHWGRHARQLAMYLHERQFG